MSTEMIVKSQSPIKSVSNVVQGQPKMPKKTPEHLFGKISNMDADLSQIFDPFDLLQQPEFNFKQAPDAWPEALDGEDAALPNMISHPQMRVSKGTVINPTVPNEASDIHRNPLIVGDGMQKGALGPNALLGADQASGQYRFPGARADPKTTLPQNIPADPPIPLAQTALGPTSTPRSRTSKAFQMGVQIATLPAMTAEGQMLFQWGETMGDARSSGELSTEVRISVGPSAKSAIPHAAVPAQITRQIAEHIPAAIGKPVQITLQPEELGRVRLSVAVSETGVIVSILAERGETLDLMRRNIDQLQQDFQTLGFGTADFLFQSEGDLSDAESNPDQDADTEGSELLSDNGATIVIQAEGLDMRI